MATDPLLPDGLWMRLHPHQPCGRHCCQHKVLAAAGEHSLEPSRPQLCMLSLQMVAGRHCC